MLHSTLQNKNNRVGFYTGESWNRYEMWFEIYALENILPYNLFIMVLHDKPHKYKQSKGLWFPPQILIFCVNSISETPVFMNVDCMQCNLVKLSEIQYGPEVDLPGIFQLM